MKLKNYLEVLAASLVILTIEVIYIYSKGALNVGFLGVALCVIDLIAVIAIAVACKKEKQQETQEIVKESV